MLQRTTKQVTGIERMLGPEWVILLDGHGRFLCEETLSKETLEKRDAVGLGRVEGGVCLSRRSHKMERLCLISLKSHKK